MGTSSFNPEQSLKADARADSETEVGQGEVTGPESHHCERDGFKATL